MTWIDDLWQDTRYALRAFARAPGFSAVAVITLALAIGLNTAIFTVVDAVLLRPLPYPHAERLVRLFESNIEQDRPRDDASIPNVVDWRRSARTLEHVTAIGSGTVTLAGGSDPEEIHAMRVDRDFFTLFGTSLLLGRPFTPADFDSDANAALGPIAMRNPPPGRATVIISHALWHRQFGGDPEIVGRAVTLNERDATVVGVMDPGFQFDQTPVATADCWLPLVERQMAGYRRFRQFMVIARLAPGAGLDAARAELNTLAAALEREYPKDNAGWRVHLDPLHDSIVGQSRRAMVILMAAVAAVLLIACANIANLLLVRAVARTREVAVRVAIGAARARLVRQWITESVVLSLMGGAAGLAIALWAVPALVRVAPATLPRLDEIAIDARVFGFSLLVSLATGVVCGLAPALTSRTDIAGALRSTSGATSGRRPQWFRHTLVVAEIAVAIVLLVGAGLLVRTMAALQSVDLGFEPRNVLTFGVALRGDQYRGLAAMRTFSRDLITRLDALPGVDEAGVGSVPLLGSLSNAFRIEERETPIEARMDVPSAGYMRALRVRIVHGRALRDSDDDSAPRVVVVNRAFARAAWGTDNVVGRRLRVNQAKAGWLTVVGVAADLRMSTIEAEPPPVVYLPFLQSTVATFSNYVIRTDGDPNRALPLVRAVVKEINPALALTRVATMDQRLSRALATRTFNMWLLALFALVALLLAVVGVYGLLAQTVSSRTAEIGVRMALGAERMQIVRLILGRSLLLTAIGIALGLAGAASVTRYLEAMLFGLTPFDAATFAGVAALFALVAVVAAVVPAHRALGVDPVVALRCE